MKSRTFLFAIAFTFFGGCSHSVQAPTEKLMRGVASVDQKPNREWIACVREVARLSSESTTRFPMGFESFLFVYALENTDGAGKKGTFLLSEKESIFIDDVDGVAAAGRFPAPIYEVRMPDQASVFLGLAFWDVVGAYRTLENTPEIQNSVEIAKKRLLYSAVEAFQPSEFAARGLRKPSFDTTMKNSLPATMALLSKMGVREPSLYLSSKSVEDTDAFIQSVILKWTKRFMSGVATKYKNVLFQAYRGAGATMQDPDAAPYLDVLNSNACRRIENSEVQSVRDEALFKLSPDGVRTMKYQMKL